MPKQVEPPKELLVNSEWREIFAAASEDEIALARDHPDFERYVRGTHSDRLRQNASAYLTETDDLAISIAAVRAKAPLIAALVEYADD